MIINEDYMTTCRELLQEFLDHNFGYELLDISSDYNHRAM